MKLTRHQQDKAYKLYILNNITDVDSDPEHFDDIHEAITFAKSRFQSEMGWNIEQRGELTAMVDWLSGLCGTVDLPFHNYDIIELAKLFDSLPSDPPEKDIDAILNNYWNFMANKTLQVFRNTTRVPSQTEYDVFNMALGRGHTLREAVDMVIGYEYTSKQFVTLEVRVNDDTMDVYRVHPQTYRAIERKYGDKLKLFVVERGTTESYVVGMPDVEPHIIKKLNEDK